MTITAAVDGSSLGNPGPAGWAWVASDDCWDADGWPEATNNVGELRALLELLRATREAGLADEPLLVQADSQYVINIVTKWRHGWKRNGWTKKDKKPIKNLDLIKDIDGEMQGRTVEFEWIKGHTGHPLNEKADDLARGAAETYQAGSAPARGPGFGGFPSIDEDAAAAPAPAPDPAPAAAPPSPIEAVREAEDRLRDARIAGTRSALTPLLTDDFHCVAVDGAVTTAPEALLLPANARRSAVKVWQLGSDTWLACARVRTEDGDTMQATTWVATPGGLRAAWQQQTPVA